MKTRIVLLAIAVTLVSSVVSHAASQNWGANVNYNWTLGWLKGDIGLYAKNLLDEKYFGFTEPNNGPDYNSFQPAPGREFFVNLKLRF